MSNTIKDTTYDQLTRMCKNIAYKISGGEEINKESYESYNQLDEDDKKDWQLSGFDYLEHVYDIKYLVGSDGSYYGAELLVAGGGPNIYVDTRSMVVQGYWGSDRVNIPFIDEIGLDDALEEMWGWSK
tara:strand:- start:153 stop:536 length:384 start_codon:yes stop_codon:yes gene_type:complete